MKHVPALTALALAAGLVACGQTPVRLAVLVRVPARADGYIGGDGGL